MATREQDAGAAPENKMFGPVPENKLDAPGAFYGLFRHIKLFCCLLNCRGALGHVYSVATLLVFQNRHPRADHGPRRGA
jgi:hypothetical protein